MLFLLAWCPAGAGSNPAPGAGQRGSGAGGPGVGAHGAGDAGGAETLSGSDIPTSIASALGTKPRASSARTTISVAGQVLRACVEREHESVFSAIQL